MSSPNLILVSGRFAAPTEPHLRDATFAAALAERGSRVRWLLPIGADESRPAVGHEGALEVLPVQSSAPGFADVQGRLYDPPTELVLMQLVRAEMPDLVHILDYGGCTSVNLSWLASRLGARCVISMPADATVCHRGDRRYAGTEDCVEHLDSARCAACVLVADPTGLSPWQSWLGRSLAVLRSPLNPFPSRLDFANRVDLLVGGLQFVDRVVVGGEADKLLAMTLGLRDELFEVLPPLDTGVDGYLELYNRLIGAESAARSQQ